MGAWRRDGMKTSILLQLGKYHSLTAQAIENISFYYKSYFRIESGAFLDYSFVLWSGIVGHTLQWCEKMNKGSGLPYKMLFVISSYAMQVK